MIYSLINITININISGRNEETSCKNYISVHGSELTPLVDSAWLTVTESLRVIPWAHGIFIY